MTDRNLLMGLNKSELIQMARSAGLGNMGRDLSEEDMITAILQADSPEDAQKMLRFDGDPACRLEGKRQKIERHIDKNRRRILSQLPGCNGKCTSYGCPDLVVVRCWTGFQNDIF